MTGLLRRREDGKELRAENEDCGVRRSNSPRGGGRREVEKNKRSWAGLGWFRVGAAGLCAGRCRRDLCLSFFLSLLQGLVIASWLVVLAVYTVFSFRDVGALAGCSWKPGISPV